MIEAGGNNINASMTRTLTKGLLDAALTTSQILTKATLRLYTEAPSPLNSDMVLLDFTEASFSGYAAVTPVTFGAANFEGGAAMVASLASTNIFNGTDGTTIQTVRGWMATDGATSTANILYAEPLDASKDMGSADSQLILVPVIKIPAAVGG